MTDIKIFNNVDFGQVRTLVIANEPWFVGKDVATALGYGEGKSLANAIANHVDQDDKGVTKIMTPGGKQDMVIINDTWLTKAEYADRGFFDIKQDVLDNGHVIYHRRITQLGREFILELSGSVA